MHAYSMLWILDYMEVLDPHLSRSFLFWNSLLLLPFFPSSDLLFSDFPEEYLFLVLSQLLQELRVYVHVLDNLLQHRRHLACKLEEKKWAYLGLVSRALLLNQHFLPPLDLSREFQCGSSTSARKLSVMLMSDRGLLGVWSLCQG